MSHNKRAQQTRYRIIAHSVAPSRDKSGKKKIKQTAS